MREAKREATRKQCVEQREQGRLVQLKVLHGESSTDVTPSTYMIVHGVQSNLLQPQRDLGRVPLTHGFLYRAE